MPELPEVEVVRRGVERWVVGRTIGSVTVHHPRSVRRHVAGPADLAGRLAGRRVTAARRRGKYLWLPLGDAERAREADVPAGMPTAAGSDARRVQGGGPGEALLVHLGMSGQLLVGEPARPHQKHLRVRLTFLDDGPDLRFVDQRTFGHLMLTGFADGVPAPIAHIAPDPLERDFDDERFWRAVHARRTALKRALLDQSLVSGVGNIYADEALWRARLHGARPTETLTRAEVRRVLDAVRTVLRHAMVVGGTSFDGLYVDVNGESGYFGRSLNVYGRRDEPCARCGTPIRRESFMNRSSFSCPVCQRRPRRAAH